MSTTGLNENALVMGQLYLAIFYIFSRKSSQKIVSKDILILVVVISI